MRKLDATLLALGVTYAVSQANIGRLLGSTATQGLRLQTTTSATTFNSILDNWSEEDLRRYRSHLAPDMVHPLLYAATLTLGATRLIQVREVSPATRRVLLTAPAVSAACDYAENIAHWYLLDHRERITPRVVRATGAVTNTKWALALGAAGYLGQGFLRSWWSRRRARC